MAEIEETLSDKILDLNMEDLEENTIYYYEDDDVKQFIKNIKNAIDVCADKTDIWDNERWDRFRKLLRKEINNIAGNKLI